MNTLATSQASTSGSATAAGVVCTLVAPGAEAYTVLLDGSAIATANLTVSVQVLNLSGAAYVTPSTIGTAATTNPVVVTLGTVAPLISIVSPVAGIQVNIISFGTSTGTFRATIVAV